MLGILQHIVQQVNGAPNLHDGLVIIVHRVKDAMAVDACSVYLKNATTDRYVLMASDGLNPESVGRVRWRPKEDFDEGWRTHPGPHLVQDHLRRRAESIVSHPWKAKRSNCAILQCPIVTKQCVPNSHIREHCSAHREQITTIGRNKGQQVRVERYTLDGLTLLDLALYTVIDVHDEEPDLVFVGYTDPESKEHDLRDRLGLSGIEPFTGKIKSEVPHPTFTDAEVEECSEFVERLTDNGRHQGLIAIAPHGGAIERHTDEQAERVGERLASKCVSVWFCKGFKKDGGAFDRWHITSTDISEESFPKLKTVIGRHFEYAVAFHGWREDFICIGGRAPADLKNQIKMGITDAILDPEIVVKTDEEDCPGALNGTSPKNIVNRLATNGIHIEQSIDARTRFGPQIADAVAGVIGPKI